MEDALFILTSVGAGASGLALMLTLFNIATWPRGKRGATFGDRRLSVLVPARNEEETIGACVDAILASHHPLHEVIVCDDGSTDKTPEILRDRAASDPRLKIIEGTGLPAGWVGKPHACHQLARAASGDVLLFVDADTFVTDGGIERLASLFESLDAQLVTAVPRQDTGSWFERLILPLLHLTYTSWFPILLTWRSRDVRFLAANGQLLAISRAAYDEIGGFEAVRDEVVDDMAFCRLAKSRGHRVVFADGAEIATCRMYGDAQQVWEGFSKNIFEGLGASIIALGVVLGLYSTAFVLPYLSVGLGVIFPSLLLPAVAGVVNNVLLRIVLTWRYGHAPEGILLQPLAVLGLLGIAVNSARWHFGGVIKWSGRVYSGKNNRSSERLT